VKTTFIDAARAESNDKPGPKYKLNYSKILARSPNYSFRSLKKNRPKLKLQKSFLRNNDRVLYTSEVISTKVAPGYYKTEDSFNKTQVICKNKLLFNKSKEKRYFDAILEKKKNIPGVGGYKELEKSFEKVSRPVTATIRKRHRY
jgi:hypothetical protein